MIKTKNIPLILDTQKLVFRALEPIYKQEFHLDLYKYTSNTGLMTRPNVPLEV